MPAYAFRLSAILILLYWIPAWAQEDTTSAALKDTVVPTTEQSEAVTERIERSGTEGDDIVVDEEAEREPIDLTDTSRFTIYGSGRIRLAAENGEYSISDNASRLGMAASKFVLPGVDVFTRLELGTDIGGEIDKLLIPGENAPADSTGAFFLRIGLIGIGAKYGDLSAGKQWSTYYNVAGFTDRFAVFGAQGTSVYNAGTDGGGSGSGRADRSLKYQLNRDRFSFGLQLQDDGVIPLTEERRYTAGAGISAVYHWSSNWSAGAAYNHSFIDDLDAELIALGLSGDGQAGVIGLQYKKEPVFISTTFISQRNHDVTDELLYVDADGWELYARYNFSNRLRVVGGANVFNPASDDPDAGQYEVRNGIFGLQFTYGDISYGDIIYFEAEFRDGRFADGSKPDNAYTIGIRYSFEL